MYYIQYILPWTPELNRSLNSTLPINYYFGYSFAVLYYRYFTHTVEDFITQMYVEYCKLGLEVPDDNNARPHKAQLSFYQITMDWPRLFQEKHF